LATTTLALDLVGRLRVGGRAEDRIDGIHLAVFGSDVDGRRVPVEAQVGRGSREANQDRRVDLGREHGRLEDPRHVEPLAPERDPLAGVDMVDTEPLC
jgi:hypothetical protein